MESNDLSVFSLFRTMSYLYWKIYRFYKRKGYNKWQAGKVAKSVCMKRFGYENYQAWKHRFRDPCYLEKYCELTARGYEE